MPPRCLHGNAGDNTDDPGAMIRDVIRERVEGAASLISYPDMPDHAGCLPGVYTVMPEITRIIPEITRIIPEQ